MAKKTTTTAPAASTAAAVSPNPSTATLAHVIEATKAGGFLHVPADVSADWLANGLVEINPDTSTHTDAGIPTRATAKGLEPPMTDTNTTGAAAAPVSKMTFVIRKIAAPVPSRQASDNSKIYPFDELPAPDADGLVSSFFVPATPQRPTPWDTMASTVSSAKTKYGKKIGEETYKGKETVLGADGKPVLGADGKPEKREVEKTRNLYEYSRDFRLSRGVDNVRDENDNDVQNEDGSPKTVEGAWVSRVK